MIGGKDISSTLLHGRNDALHFHLDKLDVIPQLCVDAAVEGKLVAVERLELVRVHSCFYLERIEHFKTYINKVGDKRIDKSAGVELGYHTPLVRPIDSLFVIGLEELAIHGR